MIKYLQLRLVYRMSVPFHSSMLHPAHHKVLPAWDSPREAGRFILGLFLFFGLFSAARHGIDQLRFIAQFGNKPILQVRDVTKASTSLPAGLVQITGYAGPMYNSEYGPINSQDLSTYKTFYYPLTAEPGEPASGAQVVILHSESQSGKLGLYPASPAPSSLPTPYSLVTVQGLIGPPVGTLPKDIRHYFKPGVHVLGADLTPPVLSKTLSWFLPVFVVWLIGVSLMVRWLTLVRLYYRHTRY